jgi:KDO2-lipid IV(A) lauroyltransferase
VVLPHKDKAVDEFFNRQRESKGVKVIPLGKAARQCFRVLKNNELLGLVGDRDFSDKGVAINFFGRPALFPQGPAELSLKTGAVIVPGFMIRNGDDSCTLKIEKPIEFTPAGSADDLPNLMRCYIMIFEEAIKKYPEQWYMFRRFWL